MKTPPIAGNKAGLTYSPTVAGSLPARTNTVVAEVLMRFLSHEKMTGMAAVFGASTTRLSAVVHRLENDYGWTIERDELVVGCSDGRVATVRRYWLNTDCIEAVADSPAWCAAVKLARSTLRKKAYKAKQCAKSLNRKSSPKCASAQFDLFCMEGDFHG